MTKDTKIGGFQAVKNGWMTAHWATETGRGIIFPGSYPQVTMEQLEQLWKIYMREDRSGWLRRQRRQRGKSKTKSIEWTVGHSLNGERWSCSYADGSKAACLISDLQNLRFINLCLIPPFHITEIRVWIRTVVFLALDSSQAVSGSHDAINS